MNHECGPGCTWCEGFKLFTESKLAELTRYFEDVIAKADAARRERIKSAHLKVVK